MPVNFESEENNTIASANALSGGSIISGALSSSADVDWFIFNTNGAASVRINFKSPAPPDHYVGYFTVGLYTINGSLLKQLSLGADAALDMGTVPSVGSYFIKVEDNEYYSSGEYSLSLNLGSISVPTYSL